MKRAVFCGTFDPMTLGHLDILKKAGRVFDKVYVAIPEKSVKSGGFTFLERVKIARATTESLDFAEVVSFSGLLPDFCKALGVYNIVRGIRNPADFVFESDLLRNYKSLCELIECSYFIPDPQYAHISSSIAREILAMGGDASNHLAKSAIDALKTINRAL